MTINNKQLQYHTYFTTSSIYILNLIMYTDVYVQGAPKKINP